MKFKLKHTPGILIFSIVAIFSMGGCGEMLDNPLKDKETGEDINLLIVDFNFFTTRMTYKLIDVTDNSTIDKEAKVWFTGSNASDIVTYAGEKEAQFLTDQGQLELTVDPNVEFSASSPLDFSVNVQVDGYETFAQNIQVNSEGKKTFELLLSPVSGGNEDVLTGNENGDEIIFSMVFQKSAVLEVVKPYTVNYSVKKEEIIHFTDANGQALFSSVEEMMAAAQQYPSTFFKLTVNTQTGFASEAEKIWIDGSRKTALFRKLETGNVVSLVIGGRLVKSLNGGTITQSCSYTGTPAPDLFGFAKFESEAWRITGVPVVYSSLNISYTLASVSLDPLCTTGATINFASASKTSFSIDADMYDTAGQLIRTTNFKGTFPESFKLEYVPEKAGKIIFRNNNSAFREIAPLEVSNLCSGSYDVEVEAKDGYAEYQVVLKALCPDNPTVAVAPTYSGELRLKNSNDTWQGIDMKGGTVDILAIPDSEYEIRLLWKNQWETATFNTKFDANGNYIGTSESSLSAKTLEDGRIRITITHLFDQSVCDDLNW